MGEPIHADAILAQLGEHWRMLAETGQTEVLRACAMTLLVHTEGPPSDPDLAGFLAAFELAHPARAIVVGRLEGAGRRVTAEVRARCRLAPGRRTQICSEQIELGATEEALADLPPVVAGLTAADLPVVVWLRDPAALDPGPLAGLVSLGDKLILDSDALRDWRARLRRARALLARGAGLGDLAWARLTPWRSILAEAFHHPARKALLGAVERIEVHHGGPLPAGAAYLAAWLRLLLPACPAATFVEVADGEGLCSARLHAQGLELALHRSQPRELELASANELLCRQPDAPLLEELLAEELALIGPGPGLRGRCRGCVELRPGGTRRKSRVGIGD